ncbi:nuclease-related domain-containing protein [Neobacillus ginsengisoli]|uniref:DNA-directed RNA polymerase subunit M/transcription elongation factor TFIIS n=1 Tax=Neobacillus ginsengisoli TaxID=904295 RepID=A0ABT9XZG3_9BACI|nr:nuclease-related domain-containing protein [Neobacillus ginsengisoli]MDQ0200758.1 DNA-directed RNA polymerase subunit M/transcription elongation factor TFIIS [Neobacillus ginsengisoli]
MLLRGRSESDELMAMRYLNTRMELTEKEKFHYLNLEKGYEGEVKFDLLAESLQEERYIINDLLLEVNNSYFQIDTLIISLGVIHLLDIKNFQGDCYLESDKLYAVTTGREYKNPVGQLKRSGTLFRQLLQNLKQNYLVEASVIFINPAFTLYQAPMDQPIILPNQVNRFLKDLNKTPSKLNDGHKKLAQKLISLHQTKNPFTVLPKYNYDQLQKGIYCKTCKSFLVSIKNNVFVCGKCGGHEKIELVILRNVEEFKLLFPDRKITTQSIYEWCKVDLSKRTFCRVLKKNYTAFGNTRDTYYK